MSHLQREYTFTVRYKDTKGEEKSFNTFDEDKETSIETVKFLVSLSSYPNVKEILSVVPFKTTHLYQKTEKVAM